MYKPTFVSIATKFVVDILFYAGILTVVALPFILPRLDKITGYKIPDALSTPFTIVLMISGVLSVYILFELKVIFQTIMAGNPFVSQNVWSLRRISIASILISICFFVKSFFWYTPTTVIIVIIFFIASLFCLTLKDVFKQAIVYKEENDQTI